MKDLVNEIKLREQFRPFAGSVLQERVHECFDVPEANHYSPFMVFAFGVKDEKRDSVAAITHEDGTCRIQTVNKDDNGVYYDVVSEFHRLTGTPVVLNTSFNLKKEPIVRTPEQAYDDFAKTGMHCLVLGNYFIMKHEHANVGSKIG
jgi:carbamoyltransferase